jgi:hypothetical protein
VAPLVFGSSDTADSGAENYDSRRLRRLYKLLPLAFSYSYETAHHLIFVRPVTFFLSSASGPLGPFDSTLV